MLRPVTIVYLFFLTETIPLCVLSQTFSNTASQGVGSWNGTLTKTIAVAALSNPLSTPSNVLRQVNIDLGDGTNTRALTSYIITLQSPTGTTITIKSNTGTISSIVRFNIKYRDHSVLRFPQDYGSTKEPYDVGYYRTNTANDFSTYNGENPNGTWTITITETSASTGIAYNKVDLIFGAAFSYNDISASTANDNCSGVQCLETGTILIGTNNGYADPGPATDPSTTSAFWSPSCAWNGAKNNSAWFNFKASGTTAQFTISGVNNSLQILAFTNSGTCAAPTYALVTGGCPADAATNDTYTSPQYANGCTCNMQLNMSSLTAGNIYYVIVDGTGGAISSFYIEMESGAANCSWLPVELFSFTSSCSSGVAKCNWSTASEINNNYFSIERSLNGEEWNLIGVVQGAGNSSTIRHYEFVDESQYSILNTQYYRLKQTDFNGEYKYYGPISVTCELNDEWNLILQNTPAQDELLGTFFSIEDEKLQVNIYDLLGRLIVNNGFPVNKGSTMLKLDINNIESGIYFVKVFDNKRRLTIKFVKL